jgi:adenosylhomocysteine nucleosidase
MKHDLTGIICAMQLEMDGLRAQMTDTVSETVSGIEFVRGTLCGAPVVTAVCGVGKVFAALCAQTMILRYAPARLINTGVAGSLDARIDIGDLVLSTQSVHHDMDITGLGYAPGQVPSVDTLMFPADDRMRRAAREAAAAVAPEAHVFEGVVATGDYFVDDPTDKDRIVKTFGALCCEMEGAAIAHVCYLAQVPVLILRVISDKADGSSTMDYPTFKHVAAERCANITEHMIHRIAQSEDAFGTSSQR